MISISASITGITYKPLLCASLREYSFENLAQAFDPGAFLLNVGRGNQLAVSWWVSAKRTRSYPYARVYNTLGFIGKKVTIIPVVKDEGKDGDRDFLQWDTVSLMSLLGVHVIIGYYTKATKNTRYANKITRQKFDIVYLEDKITQLLSYHSDALHWNLEQLKHVVEIGYKALSEYEKLAAELAVEMHSSNSAKERFERLSKEKDQFMLFSRELAKRAQIREGGTVQPKEQLISGSKGVITIENYIGGLYYFTVDEIKIAGGTVSLIEGKHAENSDFPSIDDIKDGLIKMALFANVKEVTISGERYNSQAILKLTAGRPFYQQNLRGRRRDNYLLLLREAAINNFTLVLPQNE